MTRYRVEDSSFRDDILPINTTRELLSETSHVYEAAGSNLNIKVACRYSYYESIKTFIKGMYAVVDSTEALGKEVFKDDPLPQVIAVKSLISYLHFEKSKIISEDSDLDSTLDYNLPFSTDNEKLSAAIFAEFCLEAAYNKLFDLPRLDTV